MIRDSFLWRQAIRLTREGVLNLDSLNMLIHVFGVDYIRKMEKKNLVEMIYNLELEAGRDTSFAEAGMKIEEWYRTA